MKYSPFSPPLLNSGTNPIFTFVLLRDPCPRAKLSFSEVELYQFSVERQRLVVPESPIFVVEYLKEISGMLM